MSSTSDSDCCTRPRTVRTVALVSGGLVAGILLTAYLVLSLWIGSGVNSVAAAAKAQYEGDRVETLIQYMEDPNQSWRDRNRAVWALGQLGDSQALPAVKSHFTGGPCNHTSALCQHELEKAIQLLEGDLNITAFVWRRED
jgi:uncharacterized protein YjiS (DUF1127 family)